MIVFFSLPSFLLLSERCALSILFVAKEPYSRDRLQEEQEQA
jgi:hypothetical protein